MVAPQYTATADHSYAAAGTYTVTVHLVYEDGETAVATQQVSVSAGIVGNPLV